MDDPLRQKTVPLSAETILWFEFLLDPSLLTAYLSKKSNSDSAAVELIHQFLSIPSIDAQTPHMIEPGTMQQLQPQPQQLQQQQPPHLPPPTGPAEEGIGGMMVNPSNDPPAGSYLSQIGRKQLALKILSLKVASYLKWNLEIFEQYLPVHSQVQLLEDLCTITSGKMMQLPFETVVIDFKNIKVCEEGNKNAFKFALTLHHRWLIRSQVLKKLPARIIKPGFGHTLLGVQEQANSYRDKMCIDGLEPYTPLSLAFLTETVKCKNNEFYCLTYDSFVPVDSKSDSIRQNFHVAKKISSNELKTQIYFDLCIYYLHLKNYDLAKENVLSCYQCLNELKLEYKIKNTEFLFCTLNEIELEGCMLACGVKIEQSPTNNSLPTLSEPLKMLDLLHKMDNAILKQQYHGIGDILLEDNLQNTIPLTNRKILEWDIEGITQRSMNHRPASGVSLSKSVHSQVVALNTIRSVLDNTNHFTFDDYLVKNFHHHQLVHELSSIVACTVSMIPKLSIDKIETLKIFFMNILLVTNDWKRDVELIRQLKLFNNSELDGIWKKRSLSMTGGSANDSLLLTPFASSIDWGYVNDDDTKVQRLWVGTLKRQLICCSNANNVRKLLVNLAGTNPTKPLWTINPSWVLPVSIQSVIMSLQRGFLQDFAYILVGKAKEMAIKNDFTGSISMLSMLKSECQRPDLQNITAVIKLGKLIEWETLLIQMQHTLEDWPKQRYDNQIMIQKCKQCLQSLHNSNDSYNTVRLEILEYCGAMLLNFNEWNILQNVDKRFFSIELCTAFASAVIESENFKTKKICRDLWELILPMFLINTSSRVRGGGGGGGGGGSGGGSGAGGSGGMGGTLSSTSSNLGGSGGGAGGNRDSPSLVVGTNLLPFLKRLRNVSVISVALSLLSKLHNILKDDVNNELYTEHLILWPTSVSNATAYSIRTVCETISNLLKQALKYYPQHIPWIRLNGELEFVNENYEAAIGCFVNVLLTGSEYCTLHLQRSLVEDQMIKRMIKSCLNLGCNMQAAILCQFQEEIDYALAFKCLSEKLTFNKNVNEKSGNYCDAMDAYYNCIWDPTLLEFIVQLHGKKGEHKRKHQAIAIIGQLELNANNNDEIKREAASVRRTRFLRAMAKQYML